MSADSEVESGPEVGIIEDRLGHYRGVVITPPDGGYRIESHRDNPIIEYDRSRYRIERDDSTSNESKEVFRIVKK